MRRVLALFLFAVPLPLLAQATVSTITPRSGLIAGGTIVHLHGTSLFAGTGLCGNPMGCFVDVTFAGKSGTVIYDDAAEIDVVAPPHPAGVVDLAVKFFPSFATVTLPNAFTYEDPGDTTVRVLLPIAAGTQGILGTSWQTDVLAHNETASAVVIAGTTIPPLSTQKLTLSPAGTGMFLGIPRSAFDSVTITTHVHDTTHDAESLGVDVPSIPETQFRRSVVLTGVPNDLRYRVLLRVYGYPGNYQVIVRVRDDSTGALLSTQNVPLNASDLTYLQMPITAAPTSSVVRVEVTTGGPADPPIWAFLTLTNNTTENVTTITPSVAVAPGPPTPVLTLGHWAHSGYCMDVSSAGANLSLACAGGTFPLPVIDATGHFEVDGTYQLLGGSFPKTGGFYTDPEPAHYSGVLTGSNVTLTIRTATETVGPFSLIYGSTERCTGPICP